MTDLQKVRKLLESLAGQHALLQGPPGVADVFGQPDGKLGYSQLNELLLLFGFDRITHAFFGYLVHGEPTYEPADAFTSITHLEEGVQRFRRIALLLYGNVKFAFKSLSRDADLLESELAALEKLSDVDFAQRHEPVLPVQPIPPEDAYLTGYLIESELKARLEVNPLDEHAAAQEERRRQIVTMAKANHHAYLASDHLDVYVATSMREAHEFLAISRLTKRIFDHEAVRDLKLRWFDPTQAYCSNRIDKGLAEALMLRRATCTIYLAQETDTLGKDSELASTLAQGKPVIAYVPEADEQYVADYMDDLKKTNPTKAEVQLLLEQLRLFEPHAAWIDEQVRSWCARPADADLEALRNRVRERINAHYERRAKTLREAHPLAIQVNLGTGVANGVLVVRNVDDCARLVKGIVTRTLEFELDEETDRTALREKISRCIFRVMTADAMLTNTFWNFYLDPAE